MSTHARRAAIAATLLALAGLGTSTQEGSARTATCNNKTWKCPNRQQVQCVKGNAAICLSRNGNYKGQAKLVS
jgi:hypothetical protein